MLHEGRKFAGKTLLITLVLLALAPAASATLVLPGAVHTLAPEDGRYVIGGGLVLPDGALVLLGERRPAGDGETEAFAACVEAEGRVRWMTGYGADMPGEETFLARGVTDGGAPLALCRGGDEAGATARLLLLDPQTGAAAGELDREALLDLGLDLTTVWAVPGGYFALGYDEALVEDWHLSPRYALLDEDLKPRWHQPRPELTDDPYQSLRAGAGDLTFCGYWNPAETMGLGASALRMSLEGEVLWHYRGSDSASVFFQDILPLAEGGALAVSSGDPEEADYRQPAVGTVTRIDAQGAHVATVAFGAYELRGLDRIAPLADGYVAVGPLEGRYGAYALLYMGPEDEVRGILTLYAGEEDRISGVGLAYGADGSLYAYGAAYSIAPDDPAEEEAFGDFSYIYYARLTPDSFAQAERLPYQTYDPNGKGISLKMP